MNVYRVEETSIDRLDVDEWNELLMKSEVCDAFQTYEWALVLRNSLNMSPYFLTVKNGRETVGGVAFFKKRMFGVSDSYEIRGGPLYLGKKKAVVMKTILKAMEKKRSKSLYVLFVPFPQINRSFEGLFKTEGYYSLPFRTIIVNLERPVEEIWRALNKKARWGVKKAEKLEVKAKIADSWREWDEYYKIHVLHSKAKHYPTYPYSYFKEMFKLHNKNMARLFIAKHGNQTIAGSLFLVYRKNMIFLQNASSDAFLKYNPNNLIQWRSIEWAGDNGVTTYDINGLPWEGTTYLRGVYEYKKRWDGQVHWFHYYLNRKLLCSWVHLVRTSFLAWKLLSLLRNYDIA